MQTILTVVHMIIGVLIVIMILLQSGSDELKGLGGGSTNSVMSPAASANFMTKLTAGLAALFIINCLVLANVSSRSSRESIADKISHTQQLDQPQENKALPMAK
jgi:preprotein translocase subunit SecG